MGGHITVATLSYDRNATVAEHLSRLSSQTLPAEAEVSILLVDNNPHGEALPYYEDALDHLADDAIATAYVHEPMPGIPAARNRAIEWALEQGSDALVFVDDDDVPHAGWLAALVATWRRGGSEMVSGVSTYSTPPHRDRWVEASGFFTPDGLERPFGRTRWRRSYDDRNRLTVAATNNLLLDLRFVALHSLRFDTRVFSGSDTLFTHQMSLLGAQLAREPDARVTLGIPLGRYTRTWIIQRIAHLESGLFWARMRSSRTPIDRARLVCRQIVKAVVVGVAALVRISTGHLTRSFDDVVLGQCHLAKSRFALACAFGWAYMPYSRGRTRWVRVGAGGPFRAKEPDVG
ncbi:glycosyltransferase family 2 protein [Isoptericola sp. NPDC058082]|uniref:glycosyltransferase family 2 protein n=1 Tax=Isoptericola sp. NPDC058082 TaxID=3346331 RepID=UPI0036EBED69